MKNLNTVFLALIVAFFIPKISYAEDYSSYNWSRLPLRLSDVFVDWTRVQGNKQSGFRAIILNSYREITSAQMYGLSAIETVLIKCNKNTMQFLKKVWTEKSMGNGVITQTWGDPSKPLFINKNDRNDWNTQLFNEFCERANKIY